MASFDTTYRALERLGYSFRPPGISIRLWGAHLRVTNAQDRLAQAVHIGDGQLRHVVTKYRRDQLRAARKRLARLEGHR